MVDLLYKDMVYKVVGCAMEVHRILGPGFLESVYEATFAIELKAAGILFETQKEYGISYKDVVIKHFYCDLVVENKIIVEFKAIKQLGDLEHARVINYLKVTGLQLGLLINFAEPSLVYEQLIFTTQHNNS